jgi:hypothetical protein
MTHLLAGAIEVTGATVSVRPSAAAYMIFTVPVAIVSAIFVVAYSRYSHLLWPIVCGFSLLMALVMFVVWSNRIVLRGDNLSFRGVWGEKKFLISDTQTKVLFRSRSDRGRRGSMKLVGFYLELHPRNREGVVFEKNIKVFDRRQLVQFLRVIRERGVPVKVDQVSAHFLGLRQEEAAFEKI